MKPLDPIGSQTLEVMDTANNYNQRLFFLAKPWLKSPVLDVGAGVGTLIEDMLSSGHTVSALDINPQYIKLISQVYPQIKTYCHDLQTKSLPRKLRNSFNSIIIFNVLEHIPDESQAVINMYSLLKPHGKLIIIVPAHQSAFGTIDRLLSHQRRYSIFHLTHLLSERGFKIVDSRYLNSILILGWWFANKILQQKTIRQNQVNLVDRFIPILSHFEDLIRPPFGLSVFCVAQKV